MTGKSRDKAVLVTILTLGLFLVGRFLGMGPLASVWSLAHWSVTPVWYIAAWLAGTLSVLYVSLKYADKEIGRPKYLIWLAIPALLVIFYLFRFDSFAFGGGNLRVAQIGQVSKVIFRWFEFGAVGGVAMIYNNLRAADMPTADAAATAWVIRSFIVAAVSAIAAMTLATILAQSTVKRLLLFVVVLFGGHTLMFFGYTGVEVVIPPLIIWYAAAAVYYSRKPSLKRLLICWLITFSAMIFLFALIILVPASLYLTLQYFMRKNKRSSVPASVGVLALLAIVVTIYYKASESLELASLILLPASKKPLLDYGLFSSRHIFDWLQLIFLGAPLLIPAAFLWLWDRNSKANSPAVSALVLLTAGGTLATFMLDPVNSIVLDAPRLMAFLSPVGALLAVLSSGRKEEANDRSLLLPIVTATAFAVPLAVLPVYRTISLADQYALTYLDTHSEYYISASFAFRDAYFQRKEFDNARRWESMLPAKSPDYFLLRGSDNLRMNGNYSAAAEEQFKIVAKYPFWTEPRAMLAVNQMTLGKYQLAKPQIDTCLMLEPYKKTHHVNLYSYYRDIQDWSKALQAASRAEELAHADTDIRTDRMIIFYRANDLVAAEVMADELLAQDSLLPFPYLIKGFLADRGRDDARAIQRYERFLQLAPNEPESPKIRERVAALRNPVPLPEE